MQYRALGTTGLQISEIGFGCSGNSGLMTIGAYEDQLTVIARAIELGINYFDNAPDYGDGAGEIALGKVIKELGVRPIITSKVEIRECNLSNIADHIQKSVEESLTRLGVDYLDILQIHNGPTIARPRLEGRSYRVLGLEDYYAPHGALEGLARVQRQGKARFLGFICRGDDGVPVRQLLDTGLFSMINLPYTLLNPTAALPRPFGMEVDGDYGEVIPYANNKGIGTAIISPLAAGLLTDQIVGGADFHPLSRPMTEGQRVLLPRAKALRFLSTKEHSLAQAAIRFVLMLPGVTTVLSGVSDLDQQEEIVAASGAGPLNPEQMARVEMVWRAPLASLQTRI